MPLSYEVLFEVQQPKLCVRPQDVVIGRLIIFVWFDITMCFYNPLLRYLELSSCNGVIGFSFVYVFLSTSDDSKKGEGGY